MRITVLGKSPAWQDAGGACSGYLVQDAGYALLIDCGSGVFSKLRRVIDYVELDAILISHLHADHSLDLVPFSYALTYAPRQEDVAAPARPELYAPAGASKFFRTLFGCFDPDDLINEAFDVHDYEVSDQLALGPFRLRFCEVPHFVRTFAIEIATATARVTYSADCGPSDDLVAFARDTDLLLIEATLPNPEPSEDRGHLTPSEAGQHGRLAGAKAVVITHFSDELDAVWTRAEATRAYGADVGLAYEGAVYTLPASPSA
ncbi:MAG: MBL fold metallo-hydrolase [Solirubrobacteraceae bacterium]